MSTNSHDLLVKLTDVFIDGFNLSELNEFAFYLGINEDNFESSSLSGRAREISHFLARHGQLWKLIDVGQKRRGDVDWANILNNYGYVETPIPPIFKYQLINILNIRFSLAEMGSLMKGLEIGSREITGHTKLLRSESLINYIWKHKLLVDLAIVGLEQRADIEWIQLLNNHTYDFADSTIPVELSEELEGILNNYFNLSDLEELMVALSVDSENLVGNTKQAKVKNLVAYLWEHKLLAQLASDGSALRPDIDWFKIVRPYVLDKYSIPLPLLFDLTETFYYRFDGEELIELMLPLGIDHENIEGDTHRIKARNLAEYLWNHQLLAQLVIVGFRYRPDIDWIMAIGPYAFVMIRDHKVKLFVSSDDAEIPL